MQDVQFLIQIGPGGIGLLFVALVVCVVAYAIYRNTK